MRSKLTFVVVLVLLATACTDDDGGDVAPSVATTMPAATTPPPSPSVAGPVSTQSPPAARPPETMAATTTTTTIPFVPLDELGLELEEVGSGFAQPVFLTTAPGDGRLFVVDKPGRIWIIDAGEALTFLDIRDDVGTGGLEQGLLGLAFHPDYADNGRFYVDYTDNDGDTVVAEFAARGPSEADETSRRVLLEIDQPASNHNGGMVAFGPDGYLWISAGDGGGANDQFEQGQRADTLLGTMLRIDVDGDPYAVPADNPFADGGEGAAEVWAYGLRNPWRFAFDGDRLYIADVGQNEVEEIDVIDATNRSAPNFGWPIMEGSDCFRSSSCSSDGLVLPVVEYPHGQGCSVTGGYVYRGAAIPELAGHYFYGDYCSGWVRSFLVADDGSVSDEREWLPQGTLAGLTSFGVDGAGELYAMTNAGTIWRIVRAGR